MEEHGNEKGKTVGGIAPEDLGTVAHAALTALTAEREAKVMVGIRNLAGPAQITLVNDDRGGDMLLGAVGGESDTDVVNMATWEWMKKHDTRVSKMGIIKRDDSVLGERYQKAPADVESFACQFDPDTILGLAKGKFVEFLNTQTRPEPFRILLEAALEKKQPPYQKIEILKNYLFVFTTEVIPDKLFTDDKGALLNFVDGNDKLEVPPASTRTVEVLREYLLDWAKVEDSGSYPTG